MVMSTQGPMKVHICVAVLSRIITPPSPVCLCVRNCNVTSDKHVQWNNFPFLISVLEGFLRRLQTIVPITEPNLLWPNCTWLITFKTF